MTIKPLSPQRTCAACRKKFQQKDLLAVTRLKNGEVIVNDPYQQLGRSVYLCRNAGCLKKAQTMKGKNPLQFGLKVSVPDTIWEDLAKRMQ